MTIKLLLTIPEAAEACSCCERTITRLIDRGELTPIKIGPRGIRLSVDDIRRWIQEQQQVEASVQ